MSTSKRDVRICVPCRDDGDITPACKLSLLALQNTGYYIGYSTGLYIGDNRNLAITTSNKIHQTDFPFTDVFFIDSDQSFTVEQFEQVLHSPYDIVSGAYKYRNDPARFVAGIWFPSHPQMSRQIPSDTRGTLLVDWTGAGFLRVKASALEKMAFPYFRNEVIMYGDEAIEIKEDLGFGLSAKRAGLPVWLDCDCQIGHAR